jgi:hypothetical protein
VCALLKTCNQLHQIMRIFGKTGKKVVMVVDRSGIHRAGRCFHHLFQLYQRTRQVLMAHQERPIYEFHW